MLIIEDQHYYDTVVAFAKEAELYDNETNASLKSRLDYLQNYGGDGDRMRVRLWKDFAPFSFYFVIEAKNGDDWKRFMNGGLIFHGPHDGNGSGSAPTFAVTLESTYGWSIHT